VTEIPQPDPAWHHAVLLAAKGPSRKSNQVECLGWRPCERGTLRGFAHIRVGRWRLTIGGVAVHDKNGKRWVQLPARPQLDDNRELVREPDGKIRYSKILEFDDRDVADQFSLLVLRAIEEWQR
jgi:hypothetical protein